MSTFFFKSKKNNNKTLDLNENTQCSSDWVNASEIRGSPMLPVKCSLAFVLKLMTRA